MDVLCTDKTGTLTMDAVILERHCDALGEESERVLFAAMLVSHFQSGLRSVLDHAILAHQQSHPHLPLDAYRKIDEIPFDFVRRIMSVVVGTPDGGHQLLAKGAPEEILQRCQSFEDDGAVLPTEPAFLDALGEEYDALSADGFRVLAVATKDLGKGPPHATYSKNDETDLVLVGYVAFLDPPKETAEPALSALRASGVSVKVLTGDNELVTRKICSHVALSTDNLLLGADVERLSDSELAEAVERTSVFARMAPAQAALFQTGWFVESLMTQTLIIHVIRTNKIPFLQSRPSWPLIATTVTIMAMGVLLPISPLAPALGFVALPALYWPILALTLLAYLLLTQMVKVLLVRRRWI
jgi:Mg2+-importing ATPase